MHIPLSSDSCKLEVGDFVAIYLSYSDVENNNCIIGKTIEKSKPYYSYAFLKTNFDYFIELVEDKYVVPDFSDFWYFSSKLNKKLYY
jgi:hypothetical protein